MSYIAERRQEEKDRRRIEIVDAAEDLYREMGWDAVTMDSVARRARLSRALVYVYFKDKRDLHFAIAMRAMETLARALQGCGGTREDWPRKGRGDGPRLHGLWPGISSLFRCLRASRAARARALRANARRKGRATEASDNVHEVVVEALAAGQRDGTIRADLGDLAVTSRVLWGFTHGLIQIAMTKGRAAGRAGHQRRRS